MGLLGEKEKVQTGKEPSQVRRFLTQKDKDASIISIGIVKLSKQLKSSQSG